MYDQYFGFQESPFSVTPDPHFFYDNPVYLEAYAALRYGIAAKKGFIAVTGEVGTGKTTLLRKLMHDLDKTVHFACILNTLLSFDDLLWIALRDLGVPTKRKDRVALLDDLNSYLVEQLNKGHVVCLLIDEAQNLDDETLEGLRLLSNLETNKQKLLQIVLVGQPELNAKLDKPALRQLKQRIAVQCKIVPLRDEEVGPYIDFRLEVASYRSGGLFDAEAVREIARYSKGIPRLINILCDNALVITFAASQKRVSAKMIREAVSDLRWGAEALIEESDIVAASPADEATSRPSQRKLSPAVRLGIGIFLVIVVLVSAVMLGDHKRFFTGVSIFRQDPGEKIVVPARVQDLPQRTSQTETTEPKSTPESNRTERVIIDYGSTVYEIARDSYGVNAFFGLDLIREFNPHIPNLNRVYPGQELSLPPLSPATLMRIKPDGSYYLLVGSFPSRTEAEELAQRIARTGHRVAIKSRRVSDDIVLYRIEIDDLNNIEEATRTFDDGMKNAWFKFAGTR
jgi:general secretion pathway protein A